MVGPIAERIKPGLGDPVTVAPLDIDADDLRVAIGLRLRSIRLQRNVTIATVAEAAGIYPSHLSRVESGKARADIGQLLKLANVYGMEIGELLGVYNEAA